MGASVVHFLHRYYTCIYPRRPAFDRRKPEITAIDLADSSLEESIEELKHRTDTSRMKTEKAERDELEKAGHLASLQKQSAEEELDSIQITGQKPDSRLRN